MSPDELLSAEALADEPPPASYWFNGEKGTLWVSDMNAGQETHPADSDVRINGSTITISFSDDTLVDLGTGWQWMAASSINSTDMKGCPSDEHAFRTFPGE